MARIPEEEIERLKREIPVERLAEARGVVLKPHGKDLIGLCPFHEDHEPSLVITPEKNLWHCMGACQSGGSVIDWVIKAEGVSFRHAVEILRKDLSSLAASPPVKRSLVRKLPPVLSRDGEDRELMRQVIDYYHAVLKESPEALRYLEKRGLHSSEMIDLFRLGFADRTLGYRLPHKRCKAGEEIRGRLQRLGIYRASGHEHFTGSLVIPVIDEAGEVTGIYGRKIRDDLLERVPIHLYLPGPRKGVWNMEALMASKEIILCEALIDALSFWCAGICNVTSSYGISGFTDDHLEAFKKYGTKKVLIAYDRDDPGDRAALSLADKLMSEGIECFRIHFPRGMDANEYALKTPPARKSLEILVRSALWLGKGKRQGPQDPDCVPTVEVEEESGKELPRQEDGTQVQPPSCQGPAFLLPLAAGMMEAEEGSSYAGAVETLLDAPRVQPASPAHIPAEVKGDEVVIVLGDRRWRIRGLSKNMSFGALRVNLLCSRGEGYFVDTLDLYSARQRAGFVKETALETGLECEVVKKDLGKVLLKLEELQDEQIRSALAPKEKAVVLSEKDREEAMELLKDPKLLWRILSDFERCGVVGEETNKLTGYLACVSRKLDSPLAVIIQSSSAAGKTMLMESILSLMPEEERVKYSAMTGQSLFYMGETDLKHKILAIVEEEGAEKAGYALKLLQSEGELTIASTGKDPSTGRLTTHEYRVEGPVMAFVTTTAIDLDEELLNRCIVLTVSEDREQTRAIHGLQRERRTVKGYLARKERSKILDLHRNAQRLLGRIEVLNPHALKLTFLDDRTRTRRDHEKYLTLIDAIALLHQHQRPLKTIGGAPCVEVTLDDIGIANGLASEVLGRSLDEMPPQTRRFLGLVYRMVREECVRLCVEQCDYRFRRRQVCGYTTWSLTQVRAHLERLIELEYVLVHRGGRGQSFVYELLYKGEGLDGKPFLMGLLDVEKLDAEPANNAYDPEPADFGEGVADSKGELAASKRGQNGRKTGPKRGGELPESSLDIHGLHDESGMSPQNAHIGSTLSSSGHNRTSSPVFADKEEEA